MNSTSIKISICMILLVSFGCVSVPSAPEELQSQARQFSPPANKSYIYVMRHGRLQNYAVLVNVSLDSGFVGKLANNTFVVLEVYPGDHEIMVDVTEYNGSASATQITCLPGKSYYLGLKAVWYSLLLRMLPEEEGRNYVKEYRMVKGSHSPASL